MHKEAASEISLMGLFRLFREELMTLFRQEIKLAKTEVTEKATRFGRNGVWLAVGGFVCYASLIVFMIGLGFLIAWGLQSVRVPAGLSLFAGMGIVGLTFGMIGYRLITNSLETLRRESVAPEKTLHSLREITGAPATASAPEPVRAPVHEPSSDQIEARIGVTRDLMKETAEEISYRLTPNMLRLRLMRQILEHPLASAVIGTFAGMFFWRKRHAR